MPIHVNGVDSLNVTHGLAHGLHHSVVLVVEGVCIFLNRNTVMPVATSSFLWRGLFLWGLCKGAGLVGIVKEMVIIRVLSNIRLLGSGCEETRHFK